MIAGLLTLGALTFGLTLVLEWIQNKWAVEDQDLVEEVDRLLPQTQCAQCGYPGCKPYAQAIVRDQAPIDLCPPGGKAVVATLSRLLDREPQHIAVQDAPPSVAVIHEDQCIGCTLCMQACPVDAIVGASQWMHTVIAERCTGCELCKDPCPVDCIDMQTQAAAALQAPPPPPSPCIHCNACSRACPLSLDAEQLYQLAAKDRIGSAAQNGLSQCILCGRCDAVCPSHIPLKTFFHYAQRRHGELQITQQRADTAQELYHEHQQRLTEAHAHQNLAIHEKRAQLKAQLGDKKVPTR